MRCLNCSYNNVAKDIRLIVKKALFIQENGMQVRDVKDINVCYKYMI